MTALRLCLAICTAVSFVHTQNAGMTGTYFKRARLLLPQPAITAMKLGRMFWKSGGVAWFDPEHDL
jgi:hypothetical protein